MPAPSSPTIRPVVSQPLRLWDITTPLSKGKDVQDVFPEGNVPPVFTDEFAFGIQNLVANRTSKVTPWLYVPTPEYQKVVTSGKANRKAWLSTETTRHMLFSLTEAKNPSARLVTKGNENPIHNIRGCVYDYDLTADMPTKQIQDLLDVAARKSGLAYFPNFIGRTASGGLRTVYLYAVPMLCHNEELYRVFRTEEARTLRPETLFPGFDSSPHLESYVYFDVGTQWFYIHDGLISEDTTHRWMLKAGTRVLRGMSEVEIPLEDIEKEVHLRFPGRWKGPFTEGSRGVRFWDASADNPTAAIVRPDGMQCFTGVLPFVSWSDILGKAFVEPYEVKATGEITKNLFYDGRTFWIPGPNKEVYLEFSKDGLKLDLAVNFSLSTVKRKGGIPSQVDTLIAYVSRYNRISGALPFIGRKPGKITYNGETFLNTCYTKPMAPAEVEKFPTWGKDFPWLASYFDSLFCRPQAVQRDVLLAWIKRYYEGLLRFHPTFGQVLFLVGPAGCGKSFFINQILGRIFGRSHDVGEYVQGNDQYPGSAMYSAPLWYVDDTAPVSDAQRHRRYTAMLKKISAGRAMRFNEKFAKSNMVEWGGRVIVACNLDLESVRLLPTMDMSNADKVILLKCGLDSVRLFDPSQEVNEVRVIQELPYFLGWLRAWNPPEEVVNQSDARYVVNSYQHTDLVSASEIASDTQPVYEALIGFLESNAEVISPEVGSGMTDGDGTEYPGHYVGTTQSLYKALSADDPTLFKNANQGTLRRTLQRLMDKRIPIRTKECHGIQYWIIPINLHEKRKYTKENPDPDVVGVPTDESLDSGPSDPGGEPERYLDPEEDGTEDVHV